MGWTGENIRFIDITIISKLTLIFNLTKCVHIYKALC